jgi:hypothetical protein
MPSRTHDRKPRGKYRPREHPPVKLAPQRFAVIFEDATDAHLHEPGLRAHGRRRVVLTSYEILAE